MKILKLILIVMLMGGCYSAEKLADNDGITKIAYAHFGENTKVIYNKPKTHALCYNKQEPDMQNPVNNLYFGILRLDDNKVIYSEQKNNATVSWFNDHYIEVKAKPGVQSVNEQENKAMRHYFINVETLKTELEIPN